MTPRAILCAILLWIAMLLTLAPQTSVYWVESLNKMIEEELH